MTLTLRLISSATLTIAMPILAWANAPEDALKVYVSAYGFAASLEGKTAVGPLKHTADVPFSDTWANLDRAYMAYLDVAKGHFGAYIDKQYVKTTNADQVGPISTRLKTKLDRTSIGLYVTAIDTATAAKEQRLLLEPTVGIHFTSVTADLKASAMHLSQQAARTASWREPFIGTRFVYDFNKTWNVAGQIDIGTRRSKGYQAYLGYRTKLFNQPTNLRMGYRIIDQKHNQGNFSWDIKQSGPALGLSIQLL